MSVASCSCARGARARAQLESEGRALFKTLEKSEPPLQHNTVPSVHSFTHMREAALKPLALRKAVKPP